MRGAVSAAAIALALAAALLGVLLLGERPDPGEAARPTDEDRAIATGLLLDSPRSPEVVEKSLVIAEQLRLRYGIDTGNPFADREHAARRAKVDLGRLRFDAARIEAMAEELGYSLDPAECANFCDNVRELATIELQRRALETFADGGSWPVELAELPEQERTDEGEPHLRGQD